MLAAYLALLTVSLSLFSVTANSANPDSATLQPVKGITELLMVEEKGCVYCAKFDREISEAYAKTTEGKTAPLRRLDMHERWPEALSHIKRPKYTPTFILVHDNQEVGRLIGYNGDEYFWFLLGELIQNIATEAETHAE